MAVPTRDDWPALVDAAVAQQAKGRIEVTGVWSHLACSDEPEHPSVKAQIVDVRLRTSSTRSKPDSSRATCTSPTPAACWRCPKPGSRWSDPASRSTASRRSLTATSPVAADPGDDPARPSLALVKHVHAGQGVSYGHTYVTDQATTLGLVPLGYGDGVPRQCLERAARSRSAVVASPSQVESAWISSWSTSAASSAAAGDRVVLFGRADRGEPTAHDWAELPSDTIGYEIVTRIGSRVPRSYLGRGVADE